MWRVRGACAHQTRGLGNSQMSLYRGLAPADILREQGDFIGFTRRAISGGTGGVKKGDA